jgi:hypothetical protein
LEKLLRQLSNRLQSTPIVVTKRARGKFKLMQSRFNNFAVKPHPVGFSRLKRSDFASQAAGLSGLAGPFGRARRFGFQQVHGQGVGQKTELIVEAHHLVTEVLFGRRHHESVEAFVFDEAVTVFAQHDML